MRTYGVELSTHIFASGHSFGIQFRNAVDVSGQLEGS
jgi:hypothetical protein